MNKEIETQEKAKILQIILDSFSATDPPGCAVIATEALYGAGYRLLGELLTDEEIKTIYKNEWAKRNIDDTILEEDEDAVEVLKVLLQAQMNKGKE